VFCLSNLTAGEYDIALHRVIVEESWHEWKEYLRTRRFEEHFVPYFRLACTNLSRWFREVASGNMCVHAYLSLMCTAPSSLARIYLANQRIDFPYLHRPLGFFLRNAKWSQVLIAEYIKSLFFNDARRIVTVGNYIVKSCLYTKYLVCIEFTTLYKLHFRNIDKCII
jgi:hypothetical protein